MPFECETPASPKEPALGMYLDVDITRPHDLIGRLGIPPLMKSTAATLEKKAGPGASARPSWTQIS